MGGEVSFLPSFQEMNVEDEALQFEFAGQAVPVVVSIQMVGLADGDTVMVSLVGGNRQNYVQLNLKAGFGQNHFEHTEHEAWETNVSKRMLQRRKGTI